MRVNCDNCGAVYQIPDSKLTKPVNKATCKKCNYRMLIPSPNAAPDPEAQTIITAAPKTTPTTKPKTPLATSDVPTPSTTSAVGDHAGHDSSNEFLWVLVSTASAMVGAMLLAVNINPLGSQVGLFMALAGGISALFVILSSDMGRKSGRPLVSVAVGSGLSLLITFLLFAALPGTEKAETAVVVDTVAEAPVEVDALAGADADADVDADAEAEAEAETTVATDGDASEKTKEPATEPKVKTADKTVTTKSTTASKETTQKKSTSSEKKTTQSKPASAAKTATTSKSVTPAPAPAPAPEKSNALEKVPRSLVATILTNSVDIKRCFFNYYKKTGSKPPPFEVQFVVASSGVVPVAYITTPSLKNQAIDTCVSATIKKLQFPPISAASDMINYTFVLN